MSAKNKPTTPRLSGMDARAWRRALATSAQRADESIRTLKLPLDVHNAVQDWPAAQQLQRVVSSDAEGSLLRYLYTLLLSGFRVFGKQADTDAFRNATVLDDAGWSTAHHSSPLTVAKADFVPSKIYKRLLISTRAVGGKDSGFKAAIISMEYAKFFCSGKHSEAIPQPEKTLFDAIGVAMERKFATWKDLTTQPAEGARIIDGVLAELGYPAPNRSLHARIAALRPCEPAGTVAFDPDASTSAPMDSAGVEPHLIVSRALKIGRNGGLSTKTDLTKFAQMFFTGDANHGGLAWLFGKGLAYFQTTTTTEAAQDFDVPHGQLHRIDQICAMAQTIPDAAGTLLGGKNYSAYRSGIGGTLGSWIANYIARLWDLAEVLQVDIEPWNLPEGLLNDEKILLDCGITAQELTALSAAARDQRATVKHALDNLLGTGVQASKSDIECIESYNLLLDTLGGVLASIGNHINKQLEFAARDNDAIAQAALKQYEFHAPKWIRRMGAINRLDLSITDPMDDLRNAANEFGALHNAMHEHYADLLQWAERTGETLSPLFRLEVREAQYRKQTKTKRNAKEQAARASFDMLGRIARKCSEQTMREMAALFRPIFANPRDCGRYFHNRQGTLYKSHFDNSPRQPFTLTQESVDTAQAFMDGVVAFIGQFRARVLDTAATPSLRAVTDLFHLERALFAWRMLGMPNTVPTLLAVPEPIRAIFHLPPPLKFKLNAEQVSSAVMRQIFNHYYVRLSVLSAKLLRDKFYLRCKFQRAGDNGLIYAPGTAPWHPPDRLYQTGQPIGVATRAIERLTEGQRCVAPNHAAQWLIDAKTGIPEPSVRAYLRQAPHDWYFPWPGQTPVEGLTIDKAGMAKRLHAQSAARIIGAPAYKGVLNTWLACPDAVDIGDAAILFDQHFRQSCHRAADGAMVVTCEPSDTHISLALPVKEAKPAAHHSLTFSRYVAIDLGERGLGYAVFDAANNTLLEQGRISLRSMHRLVADDKIGKRITSKVQKYQAMFDRAEERRRENVIGDFCNAINRLMQHYDAFPVLEYVAGGASTAIDKVYAGVISRYLYNTTPTVDAARSAYWCGASYWKHPTRMQYKYDKATGKKSKVREPLSLFPGAGASAYGTSQRCSACGRNAIEDIRSTMKTQRVFSVSEGGFVDLPSGQIRLFYSAPEAERASYRRKNERTPLNKPADATQMSGSELLRVAYRNLRQAPASKNIQDTTISWYHCLYSDCGAVVHAEENAAINLGQTFAIRSPSDYDGRTTSG